MTLRECLNGISIRLANSASRRLDTPASPHELILAEDATAMRDSLSRLERLLATADAAPPTSRYHVLVSAVREAVTPPLAGS